MSILPDHQIKKLVEEENLIENFVDEQVEDNVVSYGIGSYGYDFRIGNEFKIFSDVANVPVDPKNFDESAFVTKETNDSILIPPNSFVLGYTIERINMPDNLMGLVLGKSTYARCGLVANFTPIESAWSGHITVELSNTTPLPAKVYANEGIAQILFFEGEKPQVTYADKKGKYQNQSDEVVTAKVK